MASLAQPPEPSHLLRKASLERVSWVIIAALASGWQHSLHAYRTGFHNAGEATSSPTWDLVKARLSDCSQLSAVSWSYAQNL